MTTLRRIVLAVVTLAAALSVAPVAPASAGVLGSIRGGCGWDAEPTTGDSWSGMIYDVSATFDSAGLPESATVTCWLTVNGVEAPGTRHSYGDVGGVRGVQAGAHSFAYNASAYDDIGYCYTVQWADGSTQSDCPAVQEIQIPPQAIWDLYDAVAGPAHDAVCNDSVDACAALCPLLVSVSGTYGRLTIGPDGDVYLTTGFWPPYQRVLDCAPYGNPY